MKGCKLNLSELLRDSTLTFIQDPPNITSILFMQIQFTCVCTKNLRDSGKFHRSFITQKLT